MTVGTATTLYILLRYVIIIRLIHLILLIIVIILMFQVIIVAQENLNIYKESSYGLIA